MALLPMLNGGGGLLGNLASTDPRQQALNNAAFALLAGRGNFGQRLGEAGLSGMQFMQNAQQMNAAQQFRDMQMKRMQSQMEDEDRARKEQDAIREAARASIIQPQTVSPSSAGYENSFDSPSPQMTGGGFDTNAFLDRLRTVNPLVAMDYQQRLAPKPDDYKVVGNNLVRIGRDGNVSSAFEAQKESADDPFIRLMKQSGIDPTSPQGQKLLSDRLRKESTFAPPTNIQVGLQAPVPIELPGGGVGYVQPANRPGAAPQVLNDPATGKPLQRPQVDSAKPPTEFQAKAGLYFKSMQQASESLDKLETGPGGRVSIEERLAPGETGKNIIRSPARQKYVQAQRQWIDSINRVRSGANLPELEYERAVMTFFPQFGDDAQTVRQKNTARKQEERAMATAAGPALPQGASQQKPGGGSIDDLVNKYRSR